MQVGGGTDFWGSVRFRIGVRVRVRVELELGTRWGLVG